MPGAPEVPYRCGGCGRAASADESVCRVCGAWLSTPSGRDYYVRSRTQPLERTSGRRTSSHVCGDPAGDEQATIAPSASQVRRRGRPATPTFALVGTLVVTVVIGALAAAAMSRPSPYSDRDGGSATASGATSAQRDRSEDGPSGSSDRSDRTAPATLCWDGRPADGGDRCRPGPDDSDLAFAWVFPEVNLDGCAPRFNGERRIFTCFIGDLKINLSRWLDRDRARRYYDDDMRSPPTGGFDGRLLWAPTRTFDLGRPRFKTATLYASSPWSMTVYAADAGAATEARDRYWMRPSDELSRSR